MRTFFAVALSMILLHSVACTQGPVVGTSVGCAMDFAIRHEPDVTGHRLDVTVKSKSRLERVVTRFDSIAVQDDPVNPPSSSYHQVFNRVGNNTPSIPHTVVVTATDVSGCTDSATEKWRD